MSTTPWADTAFEEFFGPLEDFTPNQKKALLRASKLEAAYHEAVEALEYAKAYAEQSRRFMPSHGTFSEELINANESTQSFAKDALSTYATLKREMEGREG